MTRCEWAAATAAVAATLLTAAPVSACPIYEQPRLNDARRADAVVVGYVTKDVREASPALRAWIERLLKSPDATRAERRSARNQTDRARLTVKIDHVITGTTPSTVTVNWYEMTNNGPPNRFGGGYVFALRRDASSTFKEPHTYEVMQGVCSGALVFRRGSPSANAIREMFGLWPEPLELPRKTPSDWFKQAATSWPTLLVYTLLAIGAASFALIWFWPRKRHPRHRV